MLRLLRLLALICLAAPAAIAQPTQDEIAEARLAYINGDYEAALAVLIPAAEAGDANAQNIVADAYDRGNGVAQDRAKALEWWDAAAAQDFPRALHNLGLHYQAEAPETAKTYFERSIALDNAGSMNSLGWMYETGAFGAGPDFEMAAKLYQQAVEGGEVTAMNNLGKLYVYSDGVDEDLAYAFDLFAAAADAGSALGINNLGAMYEEGYAVRADPVAAHALYLFAARRGNARAAFNMAHALIDTDGAFQDPAMGWAWCQVALQRARADQKREFEEGCAFLAEQLDPQVRDAGLARMQEMLR